MTNEDKFGPFDDVDPGTLKQIQDCIDADARKMAQLVGIPALFITQEAPPVKNDVSKLPKWAQEKIANQEREIDRLRDSVSILEGVTAGARDNLELDTSVWLDGGIEDDLPLPKHSHINFGSSGRDFRVWFNADGDLEVNSSSESILISPRAANAVIVKLADRR